MQKRYTFQPEKCHRSRLFFLFFSISQLFKPRFFVIYIYKTALKRTIEVCTLTYLSHEKRVDVLFGYFYHSKYTIATEVGLHHDRVELYARSLAHRNVLMRIGE